MRPLEVPQMINLGYNVLPLFLFFPKRLNESSETGTNTSGEALKTSCSEHQAYVTNMLPLNQFFLLVSSQFVTAF